MQDPKRRSRFLNAPAVTCIVTLTIAACTGPGTMSPTDATRIDYPPTPRNEHVDTYHGVRVHDPYRWLEQLGSPQVNDWVAAQNAVAQPWLESLPVRAKLLERLTRLWNYDQYAARVPEVMGGRYFFLEKKGLQDQAVLYWKPSAGGAARVLFDPNVLAKDGTIALSDYVPSPDGRYVAYALSDGGTDWDTWHVREVETGRDLPDLLRFTKFTRVSWTPDATEFYYSRYPETPDGRGDDQRQVRVYRHRLGATQDDDRLVFEITDHPRRNPSAEVTHDGRWLVYSIFDGYLANAIYVQDRNREDAPVTRLLDAWDGLYQFLGNQGETFYFKTTQGAPRGRVVAIALSSPAPDAWREVVPERPERLAEASLVGGHLVTHYLQDAHSHVRVHRLDGSLRNEIALPGDGTAAGFPEAPDHDETFFSYTDYFTPLALYRYDVASDTVTPFRQPVVDFDPSPFVTEQVFYPSKDGTRVPMFVTRRRDTKLDGDNPVLLYGYGGFDISLTPVFSPAMAAWLEMGGIYAVANLRGGGEYGEAWHLAGTKASKQNVFDDFIAAAEWLVREGYTRPQRLAVVGRSNGGLLVGAVVTQRPDLFGAALPGVGVLDMLRYHTASANAYQWSSDYGTVEDPALFAALQAYSPLHNVREGRCYPPTLVTTADRDDRVVPWHSYKFAAALQHAQGCANPVLIRVETRAGHGAGKPTWMQIEDWADQLAFVARALGVADGG